MRTRWEGVVGGQIVVGSVGRKGCGFVGYISYVCGGMQRVWNVNSISGQKSEYLGWGMVVIKFYTCIIAKSLLLYNFCQTCLVIHIGIYCNKSTVKKKII